MKKRKFIQYKSLWNLFWRWFVSPIVLCLSAVGWIRGWFYYISYWENLNGQTGWHYLSKSDSSVTYDEVNDNVRIMFSFSFVWRGVWEGRIYFSDDEYWSEELKTISILWDKIEAILKDKIRENNPDICE